MAAALLAVLVTASAQTGIGTSLALGTPVPEDASPPAMAIPLIQSDLPQGFTTDPEDSLRRDDNLRAFLECDQGNPLIEQLSGPDSPTAAVGQAYSRGQVNSLVPRELVSSVALVGSSKSEADAAYEVLASEQFGACQVR